MAGHDGEDEDDYVRPPRASGRDPYGDHRWQQNFRTSAPPIQDQCERYLQLPLSVRRMLEKMTDEDVRASEDFMRMSPKSRKWWLSLEDDDVEIMERLMQSYRNAGV